jgi:hypothetical protein
MTTVKSFITLAPGVNSKEAGIAATDAPTDDPDNVYSAIVGCTDEGSTGVSLEEQILYSKTPFSS